MATFRNRNGKWQARVQIQGHAVVSKTLINKAKHLTWDYYYNGNEYYEWKKNNQWTLGLHNKITNFKKIK